jgi:two-component system, chemotaxis family, protein-glutamate methylesterase/glutaminase
LYDFLNIFFINHCSAIEWARLEKGVRGDKSLRSLYLGNSGIMEDKVTQPISFQYNADFDVVAIAASAGGLKALSFMLTNLPKDFPSAIVIVQHLDRRHRSLLADILGRRTNLPVKQAQAGDLLAPATVLIAPPNYHLLVNTDGSISLTQTELVHFVRPSADLLFESVAGSYKERVIGVVLTGTGSDGSMGVQAINQMGGTVIAEDPETAEYSGMPSAAIKTKCVDFILSLDEIPSALISLVSQD